MMSPSLCDAMKELEQQGVEAQLLPTPPGGFPMWLIDVTHFRPGSLEILLSDMERERVARFQLAPLRQRYIAAHGSLKVLLRYGYGIALEEQVLEQNAFGKPRLMHFPQLHYSISYSANYVMIGVNEGDEIGVDIEAIRPIPDAADLADMHYTAKERAEIWNMGLSGHDLSRAFLNVWVRKEACVKAVGRGLDIPLNGVECGGAGPATVYLSGRRYSTGSIQFRGDPIMAWARSI